MMESVALAVAAIVASIVLLSAMRRRDSTRPLSNAARVAAIAMILEALVPLGTHQVESWWIVLAVLVMVIALNIVVLAALSVMSVRVGPTWAIVGALLWAVGFAARTAEAIWSIATVTAWVRGAAVPEPLRYVDGPVGPAIGALGGIVIGCALALALADRLTRSAAAGLLVADAVLSALAIILTRQLRMEEDLARITALQWQRSLLEMVAVVSLAGVFWLYRRQVTSTGIPRAVSRTRR
jgi:hypothetical protein